MKQGIDVHYIKDWRNIKINNDLIDTMKKDCTKDLKQILNDPTHPVRHYFDSRRSKVERFLLPKTGTSL